MPKIIKIILIFLACLIEVSFLNSFDPTSNLNLILDLAIILLFFNSRLLYYFIISSGIILDVYSILPLPINTLAILSTVIILKFLFKNLFTNQSFYSLSLLGLIGTVFHNLILIFLIYVAYLFKLLEFSLSFDYYLASTIKQIITNIIFLAILLGLIEFFKTRLSRTFYFYK